MLYLAFKFLSCSWMRKRRSSDDRRRFMSNEAKAGLAVAAFWVVALFVGGTIAGGVKFALIGIASLVPPALVVVFGARWLPDDSGVVWPGILLIFAASAVMGLSWAALATMFDL
jgi:hypothetical protein